MSTPEDTVKGQPRKRRKITRSREGCLTCRRRRKLCSMDKPVCEACERLSLECTWPEPVSGAEAGPSRHMTPVAAMPPPPPTLAQTQAQAQMQSHGETRPQAQVPQMSAIDNNWFGNNGYEAVIGGLFEPEFQLDEATLQLWAAVTLSAPGPIDIMPQLSQAQAQAQPYPQSQPQSNSGSLSGSAASNMMPNGYNHMGGHAANNGNVNGKSNGNAHIPVNPAFNIHSEPQRLLDHFNTTLEQLCTVPGPEARRNIKALTSLAEPSATSPPAKALHLAILAWAGTHLWSTGESQYETPADKAGAEATRLLGELLQVFNEDWPQTERLTLLAAVQMGIQFKITKGDAWGYKEYLTSCSRIAATLFRANDVPDTDSHLFFFFEHLIYLDAFSTHINLQRPMVDPAVVTTYSRISPDVVLPWAGLSFPLHSAAHRTAALVRHRRAIPLPTRPWSDHDLHDILRAADELLREIGQSQSVMHAIIHANPHLRVHQHLHDAFRLAAQLNVRTSVLCEAPSSLTVRLLVRQLLAVIEYMKGQDLPGIRMLHWPLFQASIAARAGGQAAGRDDRDRALVLLQNLSADKRWNSGLTISRSIKLVQEVWARSDGGAYVDWVDVLEQHNWELFLV